MLIILGVNFDKNKKVAYALPKIFGIGKTTAHNLCKTLGFSPSIKIKHLNEKQRFLITKKIKDDFIVEDSLKEKIKNNIKKFIFNNSIKGFRHKNKLPVRGQRTHSNAKTCRRVKL